MKRSHLPAGEYTARVTKRQTRTGTPGSACVELTFKVTTEPFAGRTVAATFHSHVMVERALSLRQNQAVRISVVVRRDQRGRQFAAVKDFRPEGQPSVVMYVNGLCKTNPTNPRQPPIEFGPVGVFTERDSESVEHEVQEYLEMGVELPPIPLLDTAAFDAVNESITDEHEPRTVLSQSADKPAFGTSYAWSLLVVGGKAGEQSLCDADEVFARYARADADLRLDVPTHISVFQHSDDLALYERAHEGSVAGYHGIVWGRWFVVELDDQDGTTLRLDTCRNLVTALVRLGVAAEQILVFFSGSTGLQVMFPTMIAGTVPQTNYEYACGHVCQMLVDQATRLLAPPPPPRRSCGVVPPLNDGLSAGPVVDSGGTKPRYDARNAPAWHEPIDWNLYKPNAMVRAPNTRHEASGLYKIRLTAEEVSTLDAGVIRQLAVSPRPFEPPGWLTVENGNLIDFWRYAAAVADSRPFAMAQVIDKGTWVYADTFDLMHNGAPEGTRSIRVFRAAVNLLQVGCSREAVYQLLSPAALMSGMPPGDVKHQLEGAVRYLRKTRAVRRDAGAVPSMGEIHASVND